MLDVLCPAANPHRLADGHRRRLLHFAGDADIRPGPSRYRLRRAQHRRAEDRVRSDRRRPRAPPRGRRRALHRDVVRQHSRQRPCQRERRRRSRRTGRSRARRLDTRAMSRFPIRWSTGSRRPRPIASARSCETNTASKTTGRCSARSSASGWSRTGFPPGGRRWREVGVTFTSDVAPYELMKIRILNGGHAAIAYPAGLLDIHFVHEAMEDAQIAAFLETLTKREILPVVPPPPASTSKPIASKIAERFANPKIGDTIARLCFDGSNRQPKFILPTRRRPLEGGRERHRPGARLGAVVPLLLRRDRERQDDPAKRSELGTPAGGGEAGARRSRARSSRCATSSGSSPKRRPMSRPFPTRCRGCGRRAFARRSTIISGMPPDRRAGSIDESGEHAARG